MNDKQQLAAMGEHMAEQAAQPMCMAKRIEELEAQVRVMAELLAQASTQLQTVFERDPQHWDFHGLVSRIDAALAGKLPAPAVPEGWQLVPVEPTREMMMRGGLFMRHRLSLWKDMLAASPSQESAK